MGGWAAAAQIGAEMVDKGIDIGFGLYTQGQQKAEAAKARQWAYDMATTEYQRTMKDMKNAGLNPILAAKVGGGATPSASQANIAAPRSTTSAKDALLSAMQIDEAKARIANYNADTQKKFEEAMVNSAQYKEINSRISILQEELTSAKAAAKRAEEDDKFYSTDTGKVMREIDLIGKSLNPFAGAASSARSATRR